MTDSFKEILERVWVSTDLKNQNDLADMLGIRPASISDAKNRGNFPADWVIKINLKYGINPCWLLTGNGQANINQEPSNISAGPQIMGRVPLISWVQAGDWTEVIESCNLAAAEDWITATSAVGKNAFALRVVGNSMEPEFREGEIVTVDPDREAESGSYVIAKINHDEATFKQLIRDGGSVFLRPINDAYPLMDVTGRDLRIVGRVVEKVKRY